MVKLVTAVLRTHHLEAVREALAGLGVPGMTVAAVQGYGRQRGRRATYRGAEYRSETTPKVRIEILVDLFEAERVMAAVAGAARTGEIGDGKVWITDVEQVVRIRTGEVGVDAV